MLPVLCYGDICADLLIPYGQALASRQKDVDPDALTVRFSHGGSVANTAVTLARLGTPALFLGTTGQDAFGRALKAGLTQEGVDASLLTLKASAMTTMVLLVLDEQGERVPFAYPRVRASQHDVSADQIPDDILSRISWMHSSGMTLREDPAAANQLSLMRRCHEAGIPVALDVNARLESLQDRTFAENMQAALCCCDLLFGSAEDELCPLADETRTGPRDSSWRWCPWWSPAGAKRGRRCIPVRRSTPSPPSPCPSGTGSAPETCMTGRSCHLCCRGIPLRKPTAAPAPPAPGACPTSAAEAARPRRSCRPSFVWTPKSYKAYRPPSSCCQSHLPLVYGRKRLDIAILKLLLAI